MLPRFAAIVCRITVGTISRSHPAMRNTTSANGTKVISETSLVTTMLRKNGRNTRTITMPRVVATRWSSASLSRAKMPICWYPFITAISENSSASVSQSM